MEDKHVFIGIDYSLKSPGVCIFYDKKYHWISHCAKLVKPKKSVEIQDSIRKLKDVTITYHKELNAGTDYSSNDLADIYNYRLHANQLMSLISDKISHLDFTKYKFHIGYEGYSFNSFSRSNNIMNLVASTTIFKNILMDYFQDKNADVTYDVISPKKLKSFIGYGKFDKVDLFDIFTGEYKYVIDKWLPEIENNYYKKIKKGKEPVFNLNYTDKSLSGDLYNFCLLHDLNRSLKNIKVEKPLDDLIDAYFIQSWLKSQGFKDL